MKDQHRHPRRPAAQPQRLRPRAPAPRLHGRHRPVGSGKSSLAFDTIYAEGQRRYVESLSAYARQFLERMEKPDVDSIEGLSPAVAIEQKNPTKTSRSTVGTATEIYDYLRLLWARVGRTHLPVCGRECSPTPCSRSPTRCSRSRRARASTSRSRCSSSDAGHARGRRREPARAGLRARRASTARSHLDELEPSRRSTSRDRRSCSSSSTASRSRDDVARPSRRCGRHGVRARATAMRDAFTERPSPRRRRRRRCASPSASSAPTTARARPRRRRSSSRSTTRAAPARPATASAPCSSTTSR